MKKIAMSILMCVLSAGLLCGGASGNGTGISSEIAKSMKLAKNKSSVMASLKSGKSAKKGSKKPRKVRRKPRSKKDCPPESVEQPLGALYQPADVDTYCIVRYNFETMDWQGWTRLDLTEQHDTYFHVDDFVGLGGGDFGRLIPLEGTKSMWCGARPDPGSEYLCSWRSAPGYGNRWNQMLTSHAFSFTGQIAFSYKLMCNTEADHDFLYVEYDAGDGRWDELASYSGEVGDTIVAHALSIPQVSTKLRFHFVSDDTWSDEDGFNTDGACTVDSILIRDNVHNIDFQDFETAEVGAKAAGIWTAMAAEPFGKYSGLMTNLTDKDPCSDNFSTQVVFFSGSQNPSSTYPGLYDTPYCWGHPVTLGLTCQNEQVVSPLINLKKRSSGCNKIQDIDIPPIEILRKQVLWWKVKVYMHAKIKDLKSVVIWFTIRITKTGKNDLYAECPGPWLDRNIVYYGSDMDYVSMAMEISDLAQGDEIQLAMGVIDMCGAWHETPSGCSEHTPAPWFDEVALYRSSGSGPHWDYKDAELFQDNFPEAENNIESYVRTDAAEDISSEDSPTIEPQDWVAVHCASWLDGGIATDPSDGPAVYMHVKCSYIGPAPLKPPLAGPQLQGNYGYYLSDDGTWTIIQCDSAVTPSGVFEDEYIADLNDSLFTRGYQIEYYFTARDNVGAETSLPQWARSGPPYFEMTCLPTGNSDVLFVNHCDDMSPLPGSAEAYWTSVFSAVLPPNNQPDHYHVNSPDAGLSNGLGSRAKTAQLTGLNQGDWLGYDKIVWECGDQEFCTISDGTVYSDKSNDCQMLIDWMDLSQHRIGLWICGDNVADDLANLSSPSGLLLMQEWCGVHHLDDSYFDWTGGRTGGGIINPLVTGSADLGVFIQGGVPDQWYVFGGCPIINRFDVIDKTGTGKTAATYPVYNSTVRAAAVGNYRTNTGSYDVRTMWFGFGYQYLRDDMPGSPIDRFEIARDVFQWMENVTNPNVTQAIVPKSYRLVQNYPNPFNPRTAISFDMKEKGLVTIKLYNVAGQLVRTLVDGVKDAGAYSIIWDGKNNLGSAVGSGVYFYKMDTKGFSATKKLVLLR